MIYLNLNESEISAYVIFNKSYALQIRSITICYTNNFNKSYITSVNCTLLCTAGPVIGLEYSGPQSCHVCQEMLIAISKGSTGLVFVSSNFDSAAKQVDSFFRFAELNVSNFTPQRVSSVKR